MQYYKYFDDENFDYPLTCFAELDNEFYCTRAVYQTPKGLFNTFINAVESSHFLPEGSWQAILDLNKPSNAEEFDQIWSQSLQPFDHLWQNLKNGYDVSQDVKLKIVCFYPQGIILKFDDNFYALADYDKSLAKFGNDKLKIHNDLDLQIIDFDNENYLVLVI